MSSGVPKSFYSELPPTIVDRVHRALRRMLYDAMRSDVIARNPAVGIKLSPDPKTGLRRQRSKGGFRTRREAENYAAEKTVKSLQAKRALVRRHERARVRGGARNRTTVRGFAGLTFAVMASH